MSETRYILAIETSCDETAAAVVLNGQKIISSVVASQIESHKRFGGVVPEVSSRHHVEDIIYVIAEALKKAKLTINDITAIAVTSGPGLVGSLLIGISAAKSLSFAHNKPLISVNHLAGHIYANRFVTEFKFPLLSLVVSGGHTELILMRGHAQFETIGETRDDAAGEAFDKVARILGLPYPGGVHIDMLAQKGEPSISFPRSFLQGSHDFSFSGLKSAVINYVHNAKQKEEDFVIADVAASFQASVVEVLVTKTKDAAKKYKPRQVLISGGVAANSALRIALKKAIGNEFELVFPPLNLCGDNAAMIGAAADVLYLSGSRSDISLNANPNAELV